MAGKNHFATISDYKHLQKDTSVFKAVGVLGDTFTVLLAGFFFKQAGIVQW